MVNRLKKELLGYNEIYKLSLDIFKANFVFLAAVSLLASIPVYFITGLMDEDYYELVTILTDSASFYRPDLYNTALLKLTMQYFIVIFFGFISQSGAVYITKCHINVEPVKLEGIFDASVLRLHKHLLTGLLYHLVLMSVVFLVIPVFYYGVIFYFATFVTAITENYGFRALLESQKVVYGFYLKTLGLIALNYILKYICNYLFMLVLGSVLTPFLASLLSEIFIMYFWVAAALWFFNIYLYKKDQIDSIVEKY